MSDSEGYRIKQQLGAGLAGPIFLAETASGNVVVRQFKSQAPPGSSLRTAERVHFLQAATAASALTQQGVVRVLEVIDEGEDAFEVMEYVPYETLKDSLASKTFEMDDANQIIRGVANILHGVHQNGLTHGDLKPSNVFLLPKRELKISDFGISPRARPELGTIPPEWNHAYLAPEHFSNRTAIGPRSDQYALAAIAYHMYTGQLPFRRIGSSNITDRGQLRPVSEIRKEIPWATDAVLTKALSAEPQERYASCLQFVYFLEASLVPPRADETESGLEPVHRPWSLWLIAAAMGVLLLTALAAFFFTRNHGIQVAGPDKALVTTSQVKHLPIDGRAEPAAKTASMTPAPASVSVKKKPAARPADASTRTNVSAESDRSNPQGSGTAIRPGKLPAAIPRTADDLSTGNPQTLDLQVYSRDHRVEDGLSFGFKDPTLGELASGELSAVVRGPVPKGRLMINWFQDDVKMDSKIIVPNRPTPYGNEPTPGLYKVVLMVNSKPLKQFIFRITE